MKSRKDHKGRVLKPGESQRKSDLRYIYQYTDANGARKVIYSRDLLELREKEKRLIRDQLDGLSTYCEGKATVNYVFDRYISTKYDLKPHTRANYKYMYDHFIRDTFGRRIINEVKYSDVKHFYYLLINNHGFKPATVDGIHTLLNPTFTMAVRDGIIRNNPAEGVMTEIKRSNAWQKRKRHALTLAEQKAFMQYTANSPEYSHWLPLFTVLFGTGCRIAEVIGLRWDDIDYENRLIDINHSVVYRFMENGKSEYHVSTPKTKAGTRVIPMMEAVYQAFQDEYEAQKESGFNTAVIDGMSGFVFVNRFGGVHNPGTINRAIRRIYEAHNAEEIVEAKKQKRKPIIIPHFSCHHMRHTFCTRFCENETNVKVIQAIMGHKDITTTMDIYADVTQDKKTEVIISLEKKVAIF